MTPKQVAPISRNRRPAIETRSAVKPVWRPMWRTPSTARDGMEMDARRDIRALSFAELDLYCERVAVAVGWISVRIFGEASPAGELVAAELGRALQLTNILRDLAEDAQPHRLYLPRELLHAHGIFAPLDRDSTQMTDLIDKRFHRLAERCPAVFEAGLTLALHK